MNYKTLEDVERVISLGKKNEVIDLFINSYLQGVEFQAWTDSMKDVHYELYPENVDGTVEILDMDTVVGYVQIDNPDYVTFEEYMVETVEVEVGTKDVLDEDGITVIGTEPVYATEVIRVFEEVPVDVEAWKATSPEYAVRLKAIKVDTLNALTVTTSAGNVFDADEAARLNMLSALAASDTLGLTETFWKLADNSTALITVAELKEAQALAIQAVGNVVLA